jgi:hypothetical protein
MPAQNNGYQLLKRRLADRLALLHRYPTPLDAQGRAGELGLAARRQIVPALVSVAEPIVARSAS